jgi:FMN phosphatase YigB (HAD superfamily)
VPDWRVATVLIIDLDGVVRDWDPAVASAAEQRHGLPAGCIERAAFAAGPLTAAVTGRVSDEEWRSGIAAGLAARYGPAAWPAIREWSAPCGRVNPAVLSALGCRAADCLFVDDTAGHVSAAGGLGLRAHHFRSVPGLAAFLSASVVHPHPRG